MMDGTGPKEGSPFKVHHRHTNSPIRMPPKVVDNSELLPLKLEDEVKHNLLTSTANIKAFVSCLQYSFCSVSMILANKSLASSYKGVLTGDINILLVVFQAVVAVLSVEACKRAGFVEYPTPSLKILQRWAPVNIFFCLMLFTGMASLQYNSVPIVTVVKNVTNIVTAAGDYFLFGNETEFLAIMAFVIMFFGALAATWTDIEMTPTGAFWMFANCVSSSGYVLYMKHATNLVQIPKFGMVFVNNLLCIFFLLPAAFVMGEVSRFLQTDALHTWSFALKNVFAGGVGFFLNFASLACVASTGPSTYAMVGALNKVPVSILGYFLFDNVVTPEAWFFIAISICGGFLYSYAKIQTIRQKAASRQEAK